MNFPKLRQLMVDNQIVARGIKDERVISILRQIPRHKFVSGRLENESYNDCPLPIGSYQTISQPYIVALMTENLRLKVSDRVLEIGTGSGYQTAILAGLCREIYTIERVESLLEQAKVSWKELGITNISSKVDDGTLGWQDNAPFDSIIVTAASPGIPTPLVEQLKDKGKLVIPVGSGFGQVLTLVEKRGGKVKQADICGCAFVPLVGKYGFKK